MASTKFSIEGTSIDDGIVEVSASTLVDLAVLDVAGLASIEWSCVGTHTASTTPATITALISTSGTPDGATASFTMPAGAGQCYRIRCKGIDANGNELNSYGLVGVQTTDGYSPLAAGEENERHLIQGWTDHLNTVIAGSTGSWATALTTGRVSGGVNPQISAGDNLEFGGVTTQYITANAGGFEYHAPAGDTHEWFVNSVSQLTVSTSLVSVGAGALAVGSTVASAGHVRLPNNVGVFGRNNANAADLALVYTGTDDRVRVGNGTTVPGVHITGTTELRAGIGATTIWSTWSNRLELKSGMKLDWIGSAALSVGTTNWLTFASSVASFPQSIVEIGTTVSDTGNIRGPSTFSAWARNAGDTGNIKAFSFAADVLYVGDNSTGNTVLNAASASKIQFRFGGATVSFDVDSGGANLAAGKTLDWASGTGALTVGASNAIQFTTTTCGFNGASPVAAPTYTRNATVVTDRTLLASASATTTNNNNVLAAIIADLQANGLFQGT